MGAAALTMEPETELRIRANDWEKLTDHLFPGDGDEHGAVLLCGVSNRGLRRRLIVREVVLAVDGEDYVPGVRGYRHLTGEFVTHQVRRAKDLGLAYLAVHNHSEFGDAGFSAPDIASHERGYPTLVKLAGQPVGGVVCSRSALAGDLWYPTGGRGAIGRTTIIGPRQQRLTDRAARRGSGGGDGRYQRQTLLFGQEGQAILGQTKVAVVGCGGVGMLVVQSLSRLGVGHIVAIDPDRVEPTNLPRLPEATRWDAMEFLDRQGRPTVLRHLGRRLARRKVDVAKRIARRANRGIEFTAIADDVSLEHVARSLIDADFIFLAADSMLARDVVNQVSYQYLIPGLQIGSKIVVDPDDGSVTDVFAVVRHIGVEAGCLRCNGLVDAARLSAESIGDPDQAKRQRYVDDPDVHAPSVITLNAMGTAFAANDFMLQTVGLRGADSGHRVIRTRPLSASQPHVTVIEPNAHPTCPVCSQVDNSTLGMADQSELPTRLGPRRK